MSVNILLQLLGDTLTLLYNIDDLNLYVTIQKAAFVCKLNFGVFGGSHHAVLGVRGTGGCLGEWYSLLGVAENQ